MNVQIKNILIDSGLFEEDPDYNGLFYAMKNNHDATNELQVIVNAITDEYVRAVKLWQESEDTTNNQDYIAGYHAACSDILEELKERFK